MSQRVLVVDDSHVIRAKLVDLLVNNGYETFAASNGQEAIEAVMKNTPDLILLDLMLPDIDGITLLKQIKNIPETRDVPVIMVTACDSDRALAEALNMGAIDYITKPFTELAVDARARSALRTYNLQKELHAAKEAAEYLARRDPLTGILNRREFFEIFQREWERAIRYEHPLSCLMIDIDHFKQVNDTHGHLAGDSVLMSVARLLNFSCRKCDVVCRFGGEEFCLILPETTEEGAFVIAERIRTEIAKTPIQFAEKEIAITASLGVAQQSKHLVNVSRLVEMADRALFAAKQAGRNQVLTTAALERDLHETAANAT